VRFMLNIYGSHEVWEAMDDDAWRRLEGAHASLIAELRASGEFVETHPLSADQARVVRRTEGILTVTDGPFVELKEIVGGYYIVDCVDIDRAAQIAGRLVEAEFAPIDVRLIE
jgi:hypothetical protein